MSSNRPNGFSAAKAVVLSLGVCLSVGLTAEAPAQAASPTTAVARVTTVAAQHKLTRKQRNEHIAKPLVKKRWAHGYKKQFPCLVKLWNRESSWNHKAHNPWSGAYGIPQALPGKKMRSAGKDWKTNPATQIKWGLKYIKGRYKTPCGAWSHMRRTGWY
ncbi:lytic transglycosylase domain-containing protein [Actinoallomurus spadix]|uniref:Transglycosylase SLT domain-containing protein n=1 Tax=Actinoallomurus spadix TaxID=79912 RepID=A0ABN0X6F2_9ACTN|nr:transglycosylase SLT domain-containing protein [Actinoallomurus spadix]MCO5986959.1 lytic transglycosylase domain-containing protein [Actinoallomurus spadix]